MPLCREAVLGPAFTPGSRIRPSRTVTIARRLAAFGGETRRSRTQRIPPNGPVLKDGPNTASRRRPLKRPQRESVRWDLSRMTWTVAPRLLESTNALAIIADWNARWRVRYPSRNSRTCAGTAGQDRPATWRRDVYGAFGECRRSRPETPETRPETQTTELSIDIWNLFAVRDQSDERGITKGNCRPKEFSRRSSAVTSSHPSRSARAT